ncbi:MAG: hypothetical protein QY307_04850 [Acidimicrobiia bacterium]|nr:MAG: hypothetical protein QY307_04850 [Acidimicrobiia bacterium]
MSEWQASVGYLLESNFPRVALFALRHLGELVLKRIVAEVTGEVVGKEHDLAEILELLPPDDPLRASEDEVERSIRGFVADISRWDPRSTAARYAFGFDGSRSLEDAPCLDAEGMSEMAEVLWDYGLKRSAGWAERPPVEGEGDDIWA